MESKTKNDMEIRKEVLYGGVRREKKTEKLSFLMLRTEKMEEERTKIEVEGRR